VTDLTMLLAADSASQVTWNPITWLEWIVSWILVQFHALFAVPLGASSGWSWALAIVGLVVVIRILLIPLFVKQIKAQRGLQILQPQMKEIQKKYAGDRQRQSEEMMKLYKETGTNPLSSCLPIIAQAPIFFALFRVLNGIAQNLAQGVLTPEQVEQAKEASIFNVPIYATFVHADETPFPTTTRVVTIIMIALMTATTFTTQRQLMIKNASRDNPMAQQQKILLYVFPVFFAVTGINFPVGVLLYWLTTNLWSMGQQFYVIRNNPQPGTPAFEAWERRVEAKERRKLGLPPEPEVAGPVIAPPTPRAQPKRQSKSQRKAPTPVNGNGQTPTGTDDTGDATDPTEPAATTEPADTGAARPAPTRPKPTSKPTAKPSGKPSGKKAASKRKR
jgi:YidC/Oxa1 family membrane protein insertase